MWRTNVSLALLVIILTSFAGCNALLSGEPPTLTIDNQDETQYRLTVFAVSDIDAPTDVTFQATTDSGERRYIGLADLQSGAHYSNVTLAENAVRSWNHSIPPTGNVTSEINRWQPGDAWGYVVKEVDNESLVATDVITCERYGQEAIATIKNGFRKRWTANCA